MPDSSETQTHPYVAHGSPPAAPAPDASSPDRSSIGARASAALYSGRPLVLIRANDGFADGWLVLAAPPLDDASSALMEAGVGPISAILPFEDWQRAGAAIDHVRLETSWSAPVDLPAGWSGALRAFTARVMNPGPAVASEAVVPPWLHCLSPRHGGVLNHWSPVEAAHDLVRHSGVRGVPVIRAIALPEGERDRKGWLHAFAHMHGLAAVDLMSYSEYRRSQCEPISIELPVDTRMPTRHGTFRLRLFENPWTGAQTVAIVMGDPAANDSVLVRLHSECLTGDIIGSLRCDCGMQLDHALHKIAKEGKGVVLYLRQEGRGIGLYHKLRAYMAQDDGLDTVEANQVLGFPPDLRSYAEGARILNALGVHRARLLTNNPKKIAELKHHGVEVVERIPIHVEPNAENLTYLETKQARMGHLLFPMLKRK